MDSIDSMERQRSEPVGLRGLRIGMVGPVPPPSGGMANQLLQLSRLLREEGAGVEIVPVNADYRPAWVGRIPGLRAVARFVPYVLELWRVSDRIDLFHVLANSGWSWHLFAAPVIWTGHVRRRCVVVNYRGGSAEAFLHNSLRFVRPSLRRADGLIVPSGFLQEVFARYGFEARVVPNIVDTSRFTPGAKRRDASGVALHVLIARNLERVYDVATGIRAFRLVLDEISTAQLTVAGSGPESEKLKSLARDLALEGSIRFVGRVDNEEMPALYHDADIVLNTSLVDNMPISVLEALASGVPLVSTDVGGVRYLVRHGETAQLAPAGDARALADQILRLHRDRDLAARQVEAGLSLVQAYTWSHVRHHLADAYRSALRAVQVTEA